MNGDFEEPGGYDHWRVALLISLHGLPFRGGMTLMHASLVRMFGKFSFRDDAANKSLNTDAQTLRVSAPVSSTEARSLYAKASPIFRPSRRIRNIILA